MVDQVCTLKSSVSWAKVESPSAGSLSTSICLFVRQTKELAPGSTFDSNSGCLKPKSTGLNLVGI